MKQKIYIILCLLLYISLAVSCSDEPNETQSTTGYPVYSAEQENASNTIREGSNKKSDHESNAITDDSKDIMCFIDAFKVFDNSDFPVVYNETDKITLKAGEPVTEIRSKSDIFPLWGETTKLDTYKTVVMDEGEAIKWGVGDAGRIHTRIVIQHEMDHVYVCSESHGSSDYVKTDITGLLKQTGINTSAIHVKILRNYGDEELLFKISDGAEEALLLARWDRTEKAHRILLLNLYDIVAADYLSTYDNSVYILAGSEGLYILHLSISDGKLYQYEMPGDIMKIEDISLMRRDPDCLYIKAYKEQQEELSFYKVDFNMKNITEYLTLKALKDQYPMEWSFSSDVASGRYVDQVSDVVLISGTDTRLSGYHDHDYLYALNKNTGEKIWEFCGGYSGAPYCFSENKKYIFLGHRVEGYIKCLETDTGNVVWEKETGEHFNFAAIRNMIVVFNNSQIRAYRGDDGEILWERTKDEDQYLFYSQYNLPVAVVATSNDVTAYDPVSWKAVWRITGKDCEKYQISLDGNDLTIPFADTVHKLDVRTGKSIETKSSTYKAVHEVLSGNAVSSGIQILHSIDEEKIRCIDDTEKILWEMNYNAAIPDDLVRYYWHPCPVRIGNWLYICFEGTMAVLDAYTGKIIYQIYDYSILSSGPVKFEDKTLWLLDNMNGQIDALRFNFIFKLHAVDNKRLPYPRAYFGTMRGTRILSPVSRKKDREPVPLSLKAHFDVLALCCLSLEELILFKLLRFCDYA